MYSRVAAGIDRTPLPPSLWTTFVDHRGEVEMLRAGGLWNGEGNF